MGGTNETTIRNLRFHVNNGEIHVHDDNRSIKFVKDAAAFKKEVQDAIDNLEGTEGITAIDGMGIPDLCIGKHDGKLFMFIHGDGLREDVLQSDLKSFLRSI